MTGTVMHRAALTLTAAVLLMAYESEILSLQHSAEFRAARDIALTIKDH